MKDLKSSYSDDDVTKILLGYMCPISVTKTVFRDNDLTIEDIGLFSYFCFCSQSQSEDNEIDIDKCLKKRQLSKEDFKESINRLEKNGHIW